MKRRLIVSFPLIHWLRFGHWPQPQLWNYPVPGKVAPEYRCGVCGRSL